MKFTLPVSIRMRNAFLASIQLLVAVDVCAQTGMGNEYKIDAAHTSVQFEGLHFATSTVRGRFNKIEGSVVFDKTVKSGKVDLTIDVASLISGVPLLDGALKGENFFNVTKYPQAVFTSTDFSLDQDGKISELNGLLTLLGQTLPVKLSAVNFNCYQHPRLQREVCGGDFVSRIQRSKWGMDYGLSYGVPDNIRLVIAIEAIRQ